MTTSTHRPPALWWALPLLLAGCASTRAPVTPPAQPAPAPAAAPMATMPATAASADDRARIFKGTGVVVKGQQPGGGLPPGPAKPAPGGAVVLNFEGADLREVVRNVLGDILNTSYTIDPSVGGQVTIRTTTGIPREALPATLETLLRANGATMVRED